MKAYFCNDVRYARNDNPEAWSDADRSDGSKFMFKSYPEFEFIPGSQGDKEPLRFGPLVFDIDTGDIAVEDARKIVDWFEKIYGVDPNQWRIFLSGKKGVHLELDGLCPEGSPVLTMTYKRLALDVQAACGVKLDLSLYNMGTGKPFRQPNVMRDTGTCKRQIAYDDLFEITDEEEYRAACSEPGPTWTGEPWESGSLRELFRGYLEEAEGDLAQRKTIPELTDEQREKFVGACPACVSVLCSSAQKPKNRPTTFNGIAFQLGCFAVSAGMPEDTLIANARTFIDGYPSSKRGPEREMNVRSAYRSAAAYGRHFSCGAVKALGFGGFDCGACDFFDQQPKQPPARGFRLLPLSALMQEQRPANWLIKGIIEADTLTGVIGAPASYKSFLALDMTLSIATGTDFFGQPTRQGAAVYVAGEGRAGIRKRVKAWMIHHGVEGEIPFYLSSGPADLVNEVDDVIAKIEQVEGDHGAVAVVVIDTLARNFGGGDENSTQDMGCFVGALDKIRQRFCCAVVLVHHTGHGDSSRGRGSSVIRASLDFEYLLRRLPGDPSNTVEVSCAKSKDHEPLPTTALRPVVVELGEVDEDLQAVTSLVLEQIEPLSAAARPARLSQSQQLCLDALGDIVAATEGHGEAAHIDDWRDKCYSAGISPADTQEGKKKAFQRAVKALLKAGVVQCNDPYYWPFLTKNLNQDDSGTRDITGTLSGHCPGTKKGDRDTHLKVCPVVPLVLTLGGEIEGKEEPPLLAAAVPPAAAGQQVVRGRI